MTRRNAILILLAVLLAGGVLYWSRGRSQGRDYPYQFRVLQLEGGVATMTTPRSPQVPVYRMIRAIDPSVNPRNPSDPDFIAAEKALAGVQSGARQTCSPSPV